MSAIKSLEQLYRAYFVNEIDKKWAQNKKSPPNPQTYGQCQITLSQKALKKMVREFNIERIAILQRDV